MTTLAKDFLESYLRGDRMHSVNASQKLRDLQDWTAKFVAGLLAAPSPAAGNEFAINTAERYIFEIDVYEVVRDLIFTKAVDEEAVWSMVNLPASNVWIEFPATGSGIMGRIGFMVAKVPTGTSAISTWKTMMAVIGKTEGGASVPICLMTLPEGRLRINESRINLHWFMGYMSDSKEDRGAIGLPINDSVHMVHDLVSCLFLLAVPRATEIRPATMGSSRKVKAGDRKPLPLIEFKRVVVRIGVGSPQYQKRPSLRGEPTGEAFDHRKRYHRVVSHLRTYRKDRAEPHVIVIDEQWRGDPAKGVVIHERVVRR